MTIEIVNICKKLIELISIIWKNSNMFSGMEAKRMGSFFFLKQKSYTRETFISRLEFNDTLVEESTRDVCR